MNDDRDRGRGLYGLLVEMISEDLLTRYKGLEKSDAISIASEAVEKYYRELEEAAGRLGIEGLRRLRIYREAAKYARKIAYYRLRRFKRGRITAEMEWLLAGLEECMKPLDPSCLRNWVLEVFKLHVSTSERLDYYDVLLEEMNRYTDGSIYHGRILDVASGLNPLYPLLSIDEIRPEEITAVDRDPEITAFLESLIPYYGVLGMGLRVERLDVLREPGRLAGLGRHDAALFMKTLHYADRLRRGSASMLIKHVDARFVVITEPITSMVKGTDIGWREKKYLSRLLRETGLYDSVRFMGVVGREILVVAEK